ncbi:MAG: hypothetical protein DRJ03_26355 [Chloroflexi bacterium]|nr:MAG: hypothetical protein DRJ03_26355 [Chloroflexota bacterium]
MMRTYVRAVVKDRSGRIIEDTGWKKTNTLTKNFYAFLRAAMGATNTSVVRDDGTTGTIEAPNGGAHYFIWEAAGEENDAWGLVAGTGTTSPTRDDYKLESKIPHGTGAGQLYYYASGVVYGADYIEVRRSFGNQSGAEITINEVGLLARYYDVDAGVYQSALIARSLFTLSIPDGGIATIYYRISG